LSACAAALLTLSLLLALPACREHGGTDPGGDSGTDPGGDSGTDPGGDSGTDAAVCDLPSFDRGCSADADCIVAVHQINCCGTEIATGLNHSERAAFDSFEAACVVTYPGCGCASLETMADDGTTGWGDASVSCVVGTCTTSFAP